MGVLNSNSNYLVVSPSTPSSISKPNQNGWKALGKRRKAPPTSRFERTFRCSLMKSSYNVTKCAINFTFWALIPIYLSATYIWGSAPNFEFRVQNILNMCHEKRPGALLSSCFKPWLIVFEKQTTTFGGVSSTPPPPPFKAYFTPEISEMRSARKTP